MDSKYYEKLSFMWFLTTLVFLILSAIFIVLYSDTKQDLDATQKVGIDYPYCVTGGDARVCFKTDFVADAYVNHFATVSYSQ